MRFTVFVIAALSAVASAVAVADNAAAKREADPWCLFHGQGCWKRDAAPVPASGAEGVSGPEGDFPWFLFGDSDESDWSQKREAAAAPEAAADPEADPWCLFHGQGCWKDKREAEAAPEASPEAWCLFHGQGCWKVKRTAYAFANAIRGAGSAPESRSAEVSNMHGGAAYNAKRAIDDIATMIAGRTNGPPDFIKKLYILSHFGPDSNLTATKRDVEVVERKDSEASRRWCLFHGQGCWKRDAAPWCLFHGQGCWKRAEPMSKREAEADPWCLFHGQGCWKRSEGKAVEARDAEAAFFPFEGDAGSVGYASKRDFVAADKRSCNQPGEACDIARRAAEALITEIEHVQPEARSEDVEARWCLFHGQGCWKRDNMDDVVARCNAEDGACSQAKRDVEAMHTAARNLLEYLNEE